MVGYSCKRCPLAFEVGYYMAWDGSCLLVQYICRHCGTMHKSEHREQQPDSIHAVNGPIPAMELQTITSVLGDTVTHPNLVIPKDAWRFVESLPVINQPADEPCALLNRAHAVPLDRLSCANCGKVGGLISHEWPLDANGNWPLFDNRCPVCNGKLEGEYVNT